MSWYVKTKQTLIETMADTIVGTVDVTGLPAEPIERLRTVAGRYRAALLAHRDGGRLVAGTFAGVYFALGLTREEQTLSDNPRGLFGELVAIDTYPALAQVGEQLMVADSFDARFDYGLARLLGVA
ncbi:hypothetical protein [Streptomyces sp. NPDC058297]|uniref:hypothetical protein n=1 Tax=Streptomyces sp. NPDC058297 TaxID=3346433 RepID=UPI0036EF3F3E